MRFLLEDMVTTARNGGPFVCLFPPFLPSSSSSCPTPLPLKPHELALENGSALFGRFLKSRRQNSTYRSARAAASGAEVEAILDRAVEPSEVPCSTGHSVIGRTHYRSQIQSTLYYGRIALDWHRRRVQRIANCFFFFFFCFSSFRQPHV